MRITHRLQDIVYNNIEIKAFRERNEPDVAVEQNDREYAFLGRALALRIQGRFIARHYDRVQLLGYT